jgi:hypothetical protein
VRKGEWFARPTKRSSIMNTSSVRMSLLAFVFATMSFALPSAHATDCYGCYDDANGVEQCKTVQVQGACTVIAFCKAAGCPNSDSNTIAKFKLKLAPKSPTPTSLAIESSR